MSICDRPIGPIRLDLISASIGHWFTLKPSSIHEINPEIVIVTVGGNMEGDEQFRPGKFAR